MPEREIPTVYPDTSTLKAMSHPVRLRMLGMLRADGPATASQLAARLGLNSGATSYHLRQSAARRSELRAAQAPNAAFLGCSDSRVAAEILFDCGLGDLFVVRNIGQIANENTVATMEFAVAELGIAVIVVLAHGSCGAVKAAIDQTTAHPSEVTPAIRKELEEIRPAVQQEWFATQQVSPYVDIDLIDPDAVGRRHLDETVNALMRQSTVISDAVAAGELGIVGCQYQLEEGRVSPISWVGRLDITR